MKAVSFQKLRNTVTPEQRRILTAIWRHYLEFKKWIPIRSLHNTFGGKGKTWPSLERLGGSIVFEYEEHAVKYYQLTLLGVLLTEQGDDCAQLLAQYLKYVSEQCVLDPLLTNVRSQKASADLGLNQEQTAVLGYLIRLGPFSSGGGFGPEEWNAGISDNIEELPDNLLKYVRDSAFKFYDLHKPIGATERQTYFPSHKRKTPQRKSTKRRRKAVSTNYVDSGRIGDLRAISSQNFDLTKLIELCVEINACYSRGNYLAVAMLNRAVIDHVAPILGCQNFSEVANNYKAPRSFKESMEHLHTSCRKIADAYLHVQIRNKEVLPTQTQVNFSNDLDILLGEIVRVLQSINPIPLIPLPSPSPSSPTRPSTPPSG